MSAPLMTLARAAALVPGARVVGDPATAFARVHSDTRSLAAGDLFVALRGERFDAHDFLPAAREAGAVAALAERGLAESGLSGLEVPDTLRGLQALATGWRATAAALPLVAVTGSNGKTTVTQMVASILRAWQGDAALATAGNLNNHIGVPLTLMRLRPAGEGAHAVAVIELGMNHPGEIAELAAIAQPTVAVVNNAQREHQEFMATVEAVARENGSVIDALPATGTAVFPVDDAFSGLWRTMAGARPVLTFGLDGATDTAGRTADVVAQAVWSAGDAATGTAPHWQLTLSTPAGASALALQVAGRHNVKNAAAAAACALAAGCPLEAVARGLAAFRAVKGRSQVEALAWRGAPATLVDDSYNANPDSMRAAIDVLADLPGPRWLIAADMGEVGDQGPAFHAEVGAYARERGLDHLWTAGTAAADMARAYGAGARHFADGAALAAAVAAQGPDARALLVKGSRFMKMEQVVAALRAGADVSNTTGPTAGEARCS